MKRIKTIDIQLPDLSSTNKQDNEGLFALLEQLENIDCTNSRVLGTNIKKGLLPKTKFTRVPINSPQISFITGSEDITRCWSAGNLTFGFNLPKNEKSDDITESNVGSLLRDDVGDYMEVKVVGEKFHVLTPKQLLQRFDGKLRELNHAGMNFGSKILKKQDYLEFKGLLSERCNLYNYPTGEEWPFVIPSTEDEFGTDITDKSMSRNPKFELVYSDYHPKPLIQLDVETNLTKAEVFKLLPEPYGISFDGLENFFRTVFIHTDWNDVILRFDLGFRSNSQDFGYWMIEEGKRIK